MIIKGCAATDVGKKRRNNEDNFYICGRYKEDPDANVDHAESIRQTGAYLFSVCDGMGGAQFGEIASNIAVRTLGKYAEYFDERYADYFAEANDSICRETAARGSERIGTTFVGLSIRGDTARCYNIGDSRAYLLRDTELRQLSIDHTQAEMMFRYGMISEEEAKRHPSRHVLTQHLGILPEEMIIEPYAADAIPLCDGDIFLLCSDGLTDMLGDEEIRDILSEDSCLKDKTEALIAAALSNGGKDNVTVILVKAVSDLEGIELPQVRSKLRACVDPESAVGMDSAIDDIITLTKIRLL